MLFFDDRSKDFYFADARGPKAAEVMKLRVPGNEGIVGVMIESFLEAGRQNVEPGQPLTYGQSITDPCIDWPSTEAILNELADCVSRR